MAFHWLGVFAKSIPWSVLVARAPEIIQASSTLLEKTRSSGQAPKAEDVSEARYLAQRIEYQEQLAEANADLIAEISAQLDGLTSGLSLVASRNRILSIVVVVLLLVCTAEAVALLFLLAGPDLK